MHTIKPYTFIVLILIANLMALPGSSQIGRRFPSERKQVKDPQTGTVLTFLTSTQAGDSKIYQTHTQWTSDGEWLIFRSNRARNEALAVHENTGDIVQVTEGGYTGMLCVARKSMKLYFMRNVSIDTSQRRRAGPLEVVEVDLDNVFNDSRKGKLQAATVYQRVCGTIAADLGAGGDMALDADEDRCTSVLGK